MARVSRSSYHASRMFGTCNERVQESNLLRTIDTLKRCHNAHDTGQTLALVLQ